MNTLTRDPLLSIARVIVVIGQILMIIAGTAVTIAIPIILVMQDRIKAEMITENGPDAVFPTLAVISLALLAMATIVLFYFFLRKVRQLIDTVGEGDPFVPENAERLTSMAWFMLAIQVVAFPMLAILIYIQDVMQEVDPDMELDLDPSGIVLVIMLFILARVFRHGTRMREDLEGTV